MTISRIFILYINEEFSTSTNKINNIFSYIKELEDEYLSNENNFINKKAKEFANKNKNSKDKRLFLELKNQHIVEIDKKNIDLIDPFDISTKVYKNIATTIYKNYNEYVGFIVLCRSDIITYISSAISFMLLNIKKPIIFTGLTFEENSSKTNLLNAITIASANTSLLPIIPEVVVVFENKIIRATRAVMINSMDKNSFLSPNYPLLGKIIDNKIEIDEDNISIYNKNKDIILNSALSNRVAILYFHPMINIKQIKSIVLNKKIEGIVLISYGSGNIKVDKKIVKVFKKAIKKNKIIINISQCLIGGTNMKSCKNGKTLLDIGIVDGGDMTIPCAVAKLSFVLANYANNHKDYLTKSIVGEITNNNEN